MNELSDNLVLNEYPNHGAGGYEASRDTSRSELPTRLCDLGFKELDEQDADSTTFKRVEGPMVIYIVVTPRNRGPNRAVHTHLDKLGAQHIDITAEYARDLLNGRPNSYMIEAY